MTHINLKNKIIVISAGASGIGWATTKVCIANGAAVFLCDINAQAINKIKKHPLYNKKIFTSNANAADEKQVISFFKTIKNKYKHIDCLINNVGVAGPTGSLEKINSNDWKKNFKY